MSDWSNENHPCPVCGIEMILSADNHDFSLLCGYPCEEVYNINPLAYPVVGKLYLRIRHSPAAARLIE